MRIAHQVGIGTSNSPGSTMTRNRIGITDGQEPTDNSIFGKTRIRLGTGSTQPTPNGSPQPGTPISPTPTARTIRMTVPRTAHGTGQAKTVPKIRLEALQTV